MSVRDPDVARIRNLGVPAGPTNDLHTGAPVSRRSAVTRVAAAPPIRISVLRGSVPGEYAAMLLVVFAGFGAVCWSLQLAQRPELCALLAATPWIAMRAVGAWSGCWQTPIVTLCLTASALWVYRSDVSTLPVSFRASLMSPLACSFILAFVLVFDFLDLWWNRKRG